MKKYIFLLVLVVATVFSCTDRDDDISKVNLRIKNTSDITFEEVTVQSDSTVFTNISSGSFSDYKEFDTLFSYAYINILSEDQTYTLQPIDFVGETPLEIGFYTYELNIDENGQVLLNFVEN